jgi:ribonuclease P protein component
MSIFTLKKRSEFLRLRGGARWANPAFVLETKPRPDDAAADGGSDAPPRFGFTITKQIGSAVVRNRVRRRLKALVARLAPRLAQAGYDYVIIARAGAIDRPFAALEQDLEQAFRRVHAPRRARPADTARKTD